jgi:hypothetical protein
MTILNSFCQLFGWRQRRHSCLRDSLRLAVVLEAPRALRLGDSRHGSGLTQHHIFSTLQYILLNYLFVFNSLARRQLIINKLIRTGLAVEYRTGIGSSVFRTDQT